MSQTERKIRRPRTTQLQYSIYVNFLEENPLFLENKSVHHNTDYLTTKWYELSDLLNKCPGPTLSVQLWKSVLRSWRCDVRKKYKLLGDNSPKILTIPEQKYIELTNRYTEDDSYAVKYLQQSVDDVDTDSNDVTKYYELHEVENTKIKTCPDETAASDDNEEELNNEDSRYSVTVCSEVDNLPMVPSEIPVSCELNEVPENKIDHKPLYMYQQKQNGRNEVNDHKGKHRPKRKRSDASLSENSSSYRPPEYASNEGKSIADALSLLSSNMSRLADSMSSISHSQWKIAEAQAKLAEAEAKLAAAKLAKYKQKK